MTSLCFQWPTSQCVSLTLSAALLPGEHKETVILQVRVRDCVCDVFARERERYLGIRMHACMYVSSCAYVCVFILGVQAVQQTPSSTLQHRPWLRSSDILRVSGE